VSGFFFIDILPTTKFVLNSGCTRWRPLEASLSALNNEEIIELVEVSKDRGRPPPLDIEALLTKVLPPILTEPGKCSHHSICI
jgi:hypothetical protein